MTTDTKLKKRPWQDQEYQPSYSIPRKHRTHAYLASVINQLDKIPLEEWNISDIEKWADFLCAFYDQRLMERYNEQLRNKRMECDPEYKKRRSKCRNLPDSAFRGRKKRAKNLSQSICEWSDKKKVAALYKACARLNKEAGFRKYNVDHIIPLVGKINGKGPQIVSGLHNDHNLTITLAADNLKKWCKFDPATYTQ